MLHCKHLYNYYLIEPYSILNSPKPFAQNTVEHAKTVNEVHITFSENNRYVCIVSIITVLYRIYRKYIEFIKMVYIFFGFAAAKAFC